MLHICPPRLPAPPHGHDIYGQRAGGPVLCFSVFLYIMVT